MVIILRAIFFSGLSSLAISHSAVESAGFTWQKSHSTPKAFSNSCITESIACSEIFLGSTFRFLNFSPGGLLAAIPILTKAITPPITINFLLNFMLSDLIVSNFKKTFYLSIFQKTHTFLAFDRYVAGCCHFL